MLPGLPWKPTTGSPSLLLVIRTDLEQNRSGKVRPTEQTEAKGWQKGLYTENNMGESLEARMGRV